MITISEKASIKIIKLIEEEGFKIEEKYLRIGVKGSGCAGLSYDLGFDDKMNEGDQLFEDNGVKIVCDKRSFLYLFGTELDYSDGLNGKGFQFNNPNASRTCSCNMSFSV